MWCRRIISSWTGLLPGKILLHQIPRHQLERWEFCLSVSPANPIPEGPSTNIMIRAWDSFSGFMVMFGAKCSSFEALDPAKGPLFSDGWFDPSRSRLLSGIRL